MGPVESGAYLSDGQIDRQSSERDPELNRVKSARHHQLKGDGFCALKERPSATFRREDRKDHEARVANLKQKICDYDDVDRHEGHAARGPVQFCVVVRSDGHKVSQAKSRSARPKLWESESYLSREVFVTIEVCVNKTLKLQRRQ